MKRFAAFVLSFALLFSLGILSGCNGGGSGDGTENLQKRLDKLEDKVDEITGRLEEAEAKIALLNAALTPDFDKEYSLGDTVTVKSNGVPLYKVRLVSFAVGEFDWYYLTGQVTNLNMPSVYVKTYFDAYGYDCNADNPRFFFLGNLAGIDAPPAFNQSVAFQELLGGNKFGDNVITHIVIGIPNTVDNVRTVLPYAKYKL